MSENDRREIVRQVKMKTVSMEEARWKCEKEDGCIIAISEAGTYKLIRTDSASGCTRYGWIELTARTECAHPIRCEQFRFSNQAIDWWMDEYPTIKIYLYPSMKGVL